MYLEVIVPERLLGIRSYIVVRKKLYMADDFTTKQLLGPRCSSLSENEVIRIDLAKWQHFMYRVWKDLKNPLN